MNTTTVYEKHEQATAALAHVAGILKAEKPNDDVTIEYLRMDDIHLREISDWDIQRFHLIARDEYVLIRKREEYDGQYHLLYVINVSALSVLAIAAETMDLLSRKF